MHSVIKPVVAPLGPRVRTVARARMEWLVGACVCAVAGASVTSTAGTRALAIGAALTVGVLVGRWNRGALIGLLMLGVLNGIPFLDTRPSAQAGANALDDIFVLGLLASLALFNLAGIPKRPHDRTLKWTYLWATAFLSWWLITTARTALFDGVPFVTAVLYGREFLYFGLMLPLLLGAVRERRHVAGLIATLGAGAFTFAIGLITIALFKSGTSPLIHVGKTADFQGFTRVYAPMADLLTAFLIMATAFTITARIRGRTLVFASLVSAIAATAIALEFTRALYISVFLAYVVTWLLWSVRKNQAAQRIRNAGLATAGVIIACAAFAGVLGLGVSNDSAVGTIATRATSGIESNQNYSDSVTYRTELAGTSLSTLGNNWPSGLGFLDPGYRYFTDLPNGSIRNSDLGFFNVLMTMGIVGLLLIYLLPGAVLAKLLRNSHRDRQQPFEWVQVGTVTWLISTLISSITLVTLFSVPGLITVAAILTIGLNCLPVVEDQQGS